MDIQPMVDAAIITSREWFNALDRTRLGSFAYYSETIILRHAYMSMRLNRFKKLDIAIEVGRYFDELEYEFYQSYELEEKDSARRSAEICLWWELSGESKLRLQADKFLISLHQWGETRKVLDWYVRYRAVYKNPDYADYYTAGIYDNLFIDRCLADGIDIAVAKELVDSQ